MEPQAFKRNHLAHSYCDSLAGNGIADASSGLFLAAPRRVGKSTFLIEDLIPEAEQRDWIPIYADLWANKKVDPALLITEAIKAVLVDYKSKLGKLAKRVRLEKISLLKTIEFDFSEPGLPTHFTLTDLLLDLIQLANKPVLLVIDEAQHTLTSSDGLNAMFAIKSARDQINRRRKAPKLMLVLTGSNRDKLAQLVIKKEQPFFGSLITAFPLLGREYTDFFTEEVNQSLASDNQFTQDSVWEAFQLIGHRPEVLRQIVGQVAIGNEAGAFSELLTQDASFWHSQLWQEFETEFSKLPPLQRVVLTALIEQGQTWSPFSETALNYYSDKLEQPTVAASSVQTALNALRDHGFIWQSSRGGYALEDESFIAWFEHTQAS